MPIYKGIAAIDRPPGPGEIGFTTMPTKAQVLAAARRRYGSRAFVAEKRNALNAAQRAEHVAKQRELKDQLDSAEARRKALGNVWLPLLNAAEFWRDVNGDEPSGQQLREAIAKAREYQDLTELCAATRAEWEAGRSRSYSFRWSAGNDNEVFRSVLAQADTLDELLAEITGCREIAKETP